MLSKKNMDTQIKKLPPYGDVKYVTLFDKDIFFIPYKLIGKNRWRPAVIIKDHDNPDDIGYFPVLFDPSKIDFGYSTEEEANKSALTVVEKLMGK